MIVKDFRLLNYKGFRAVEPIRLMPGLNVITGANNSGKSALIEGLSLLPFGARPHRQRAKPRTHPLDPRSVCELTLEFEGRELKELLLACGQFSVLVQNPDNETAINERINASLAQQVVVKLRNNSGSGIQWEYIEPRRSLFEGSELGPHMATLEGNIPSEYFRVMARAQGGENTAPILGRYVAQAIYRFHAERVGLSRCAVGETPLLQSNCQNLPAVLQVLQSDHFAFEELNERLKFIFPNVFRVSTIPIQGSNVEIRVWFTEPRERREDLAIPLSECGTGVSQVLAMLYVIIANAEPRVVVIDEPSSFLNPGAIRKLVYTLRQYPRHQYVLATHSPEIVASTGAHTVHLVTWVEGQSCVTSMSSSDADDLRTILTELGVRISDVFGADAILWVEGPTERDCAAEILAEAGIIAGLEFNIVPLCTVGNLEGASSRIIWDLHQKISQQNSLIPRTLGYVLDREGRSDVEREQMQRESKGLVRFLQRRMFENYLLDAEALAALINHLDGVNGAHTSDEINAWVMEAASDPRIARGLDPPESISDAGWAASVHGANLLKKLLSQLTDARFEYRKVEHGVWLTKWLLENKPERLRELTELYVSLVRPRGQGAPV